MTDEVRRRTSRDEHELEHVILLAVVGSLVLWVEEARKLAVRRRARRGRRGGQAPV